MSPATVRLYLEPAVRSGGDSKSLVNDPRAIARRVLAPNAWLHHTSGLSSASAVNDDNFGSSPAVARKWRAMKRRDYPVRIHVPARLWIPHERDCRASRINGHRAEVCTPCIVDSHDFSIIASDMLDRVVSVEDVSRNTTSRARAPCLSHCKQPNTDACVVYKGDLVPLIHAMGCPTVPQEVVLDQAPPSTVNHHPRRTLFCVKVKPAMLIIAVSCMRVVPAILCFNDTFSPI